MNVFKYLSPEFIQQFKTAKEIKIAITSGISGGSVYFVAGLYDAMTNEAYIKILSFISAFGGVFIMLLNLTIHIIKAYRAWKGDKKNG